MLGLVAGLFVLFAVGSVLFRDHFARKKRRAEGSAAADMAEVEGGGAVLRPKEPGHQLPSARLGSE
jgi:hypothetical protein